jgi:hypothetical protein
VSTAEDFLDAAQTLLDHGSHSGHWRRSVSTSYYALFHALTSAAAVVVFNDALTQQAALRWFDHAAIRRVSKAIGDAPADETDSKLVRWVNETGGKFGFSTCPDRRLKTIGQSFVVLYKQREQADYYRPGEIDFSEDSADAVLSSARQCCQLVADIAGLPDFHRMASGMLRESVGRRTQ